MAGHVCLAQESKYLDEIAKKVGDLQQIALQAGEVGRV